MSDDQKNKGVASEFSSTYQVPSEEDIAKSLPIVASGARWFWWIAGLSMVNTIMAYTGARGYFVVGLGLTELVTTLLHEARVVASMINVVIVGFFFLMGWFATKGKIGAFFVGSLVYVLDAGVYMYLQNWMAVAFHVLALFYILQAAFALRAALQPISLDV